MRPSLLLVCLVWLATQGYAQRGRDHWGCVPWNYAFLSQAYAVLTTDTPGSATIDAAGVRQTVTVAPSAPTLVPLPSGVYRSEVETPVPSGIHVTSNVPIQVELLTRNFGFSEATRVMATEDLATSYTALIYPSENPGVPTVSIVATHDSTIIHVLPSSPTSTGRMAGVRLDDTLMMGEVLNVFGTMDTLAFPGADLSGTTITANAPIAVFAGHTWAFVPSWKQASNPLFEQVPPPAFAGTRYLLAPRPLHRRDLARIMPTIADAAISIDGGSYVTVPKGSVLDAYIDSVTFVQATAPVLVAQLSLGYTVDGRADRSGDPSLAFVPPFGGGTTGMRTATFAVIDSMFPVNNLSVLVPGRPASSLTLDGADMRASLVRTLPDGSSLYRTSVANGAHRVQGAEPLWATVMGESAVDSYAYTILSEEGGAIVDTTRPIGDVTGTCDTGFHVAVRDTGIDATGILDVSVISALNMLVSIPSISGCPMRVDVSVSVLNKGQPASANLLVHDCSGNATIILIGCGGPPRDTIPPHIGLSGDCTSGFKLSISDTARPMSGIASIAVVDSMNVIIVLPVLKCDSFAQVSVIPADPTRSSWFTLLVTDCAGNTATVSDTCIIVTPDRTPPSFQLSGDCASGMTVAVRDTGNPAKGLQSIDVVDSQNVILAIPAVACDLSATVTARPRDPLAASWFTLSATDCAGNVSTFSDTCPAIPPTPAGLSVDSARGPAGTFVTLPIRLARMPAVHPSGGTIALSWNPEVAFCTEVLAGGVLGPADTVTLASTGVGTASVNIARAGGMTIDAPGVLVSVRFRLLAGVPRQTTVHIVDSATRLVRDGAVVPDSGNVDGLIIVDTVCGAGGVVYVSTVTARVLESPVTDELRLRIHGEESGDATITLWSSLGSRVAEKIVEVGKDDRDYAIPCRAIPSGVYTVTVAARTGVATARAVIVH